MEIAGVPLREGAKDVQAVCIDFCTEEARYTTPDSRIVHIPRDIWHEFVKRKNGHRMGSTPLFVGIRNTNNRKGKKFYFGRVEPSVNTANSNHTMALLPGWLFECLEMDIMDAKIDIVYVPLPQDVDKIILKGNKSSYVNTDVKTELEEKLGSWNCINIDEKFEVREVTFTVIDLRSSDGKKLEFGSIYNLQEVKLEFEEPDDMKEIRERMEKEKKLEEERKNRPIQRARCDNSSSQDKKSGTHFGAHVSGFSHTGEVEQKIGGEEKHDYLPFQGDGLKTGSTHTKPLTKAEILEARLKKIKELEEQNK